MSPIFRRPLRRGSHLLSAGFGADASGTAVLSASSSRSSSSASQHGHYDRRRRGSWSKMRCSIHQMRAHVERWSDSSTMGQERSSISAFRSPPIMSHSHSRTFVQPVVYHGNAARKLLRRPTIFHRSFGSSGPGLHRPHLPDHVVASKLSAESKAAWRRFASMTCCAIGRSAQRTVPALDPTPLYRRFGRPTISKPLSAGMIDRTSFPMAPPDDVPDHRRGANYVRV